MKAFLFENNDWLMHDFSNKKALLSIYYKSKYIFLKIFFRHKYLKKSSADILRLFKKSDKDPTFYNHLEICLSRKYSKSKIYQLATKRPLSFFYFPYYYLNKKPQLYESKIKNKKLLICFTGHAQQLNISIPEFQTYAFRHFQYVLYLYDNESNFYLNDFRSKVLTPIKKIIEILDINFISTLGTSGGGAAALSMFKYFNIQSCLACSPIIKANNELLESLNNNNYDFFKNSRIFFNSRAIQDVSSYKLLREKLPDLLFNENVFNINFLNSSHATLMILEKIGLLNYELNILTDDKNKRIKNNINNS